MKGPEAATFAKAWEDESDEALLGLGAEKDGSSGK